MPSPRMVHASRRSGTLHSRNGCCTLVASPLKVSFWPRTALGSPLKVSFWPRTALGQDPRRRHMGHAPTSPPLRLGFLWATGMLLELRQVVVAGQRLQHLGQLRGRHGRKDLPLLLRDRYHHAPIRACYLIRQVVARQRLLNLLDTVDSAQSGFDHGQDIECQQRYTETEQGRLRIGQRVDLTLQGDGEFLECRLDRPALLVQTRDYLGADPEWQIGQDVDLRVPGARLLLQLNRDAPQVERGTGLIVDANALLVNTAGSRAPTIAPLAQRLPGQVAVVADDPTGLPGRQREPEVGRAEIPIGDPEVARGDERYNSRQRGTLLGVAVLTAQHLRDQHRFAVEDCQRMTRQGPGRHGAQFLQPVFRTRQVITIQDAY